MKNNVFIFSLIGIVALFFLGLFFIFKNLSTDSANDPGGDVYNLSNIEEKTRANQPRRDSSKEKDQSDAHNRNKSNQVSNQAIAEQSQMDTPAIDQNPLQSNAESTSNQSTQPVLNASKLESFIEITLLDNLSNKPLQNLAVTLKLRNDRGEDRSLSLNSDVEGKIRFTEKNTNSLDMQIITKEYAVYSERSIVSLGKNTRVVKLSKGGILEVKVTTSDNRHVDKLMAKISVCTFLRTHISFENLREVQLDGLPMDYNQANNIFSLRLPEGHVKINFHSPSYADTTSHEILIQSETTTSIEILLTHGRTIYFDVETAPKPNALLIQDMNKQVKIQRNDKDLYEYATTESVPAVRVFADGYFAEDVILISDQDTYKLSFTPSSVGTLYIKNPNGEAVVGAVVEYLIDSLQVSLISDKDGVVKITGIPETTRIMFSFERSDDVFRSAGVISATIQHPDYILSNQHVIWEFDAERASTEEIKLVPKVSVMGKVFYKDSPVSNALVFCERKMKSSVRFSFQQSNSIVKTYSANDGSYSISELAFGDSLSENKIWAFHPDFGIATETLTLEDNQRAVDLHLQEQKNALIRLVDENNKPLSGKNIILTHQLMGEFSVTVSTNEKGEAQLKNLLTGNYYIELDDMYSSLQEERVNTSEVFSSVLTLKAISNSMARVKVLMPDGTPFNGVLAVYFDFSGKKYPLYVESGENGIFYFQLKYVKDSSVRYNLIFEAQGYIPIIKEMSTNPTESKASLLQNELILNLQVGENITLQVIDELSGLPVRDAIVKLSLDSSSLYKTNHLGEVLLNNVNKNNIINIVKNGYCGAQTKLHDAQSNQIIVRLKQSGGLKGRIYFNAEKNASYSMELYRQNSNHSRQAIDAKGGFIFSNICPGEYTLALKKNNEQSVRLPGVIRIESGKVAEVDVNHEKDIAPMGTLSVSLYEKNGRFFEGESSLILIGEGGSWNGSVKMGKANFEKILPGQYGLLWRNDRGNQQMIVGNITILPNTNTLDLYVPGAKLTISVKNERSEALKVMTTLCRGETFKKGFFISPPQRRTEENGESTYHGLMPKIPYYIIVEDGFKSNYQIGVVGPIILEPGQNAHIDYILPDGRKIPQIQIVDKNNKPIADAGFIIKTTGDTFAQRTSKKEWDLYPYSNKDGFLQENGWPKENFVLRVGKENYECKEILINSDFDSSQLLQIQLNPASTIQVNFTQSLPLQISVGILDSNGNLLQNPTPVKTYFSDVISGKRTFLGLNKGTYFIGYYWNNTDVLISRQGPIQIETGANVNVNSNLVIRN